MGKSSIPKDIRQNEINYICTLLNHNLIRTTQDLIANFDLLIEQIQQNKHIFKEAYTPEQCVQILKKAITTYNNVYDYKITLKEEIIDNFISSERKKNDVGTIHKTAVEPSVEDDLTKVTKGYDRLEMAQEKVQQISGSILQVLTHKEFAVVPQIIIGSGDTGTTLWLEQYKEYHGTSQAQLAQGELPPILIIGADPGNWKHDYTLAQPHSILERTECKENPSIYLPTDYYQKNPHANGRHVYQANQVNLGFTEAPLLRATVLRVEKRSNHLGDWESPDQEYRLVVKIPNGAKNIYANELKICTGLGPARNIISGSLLSSAEFACLNKLDLKKGFTPIVDGNQFILTDTEEHAKAPRKIVIYGGGGTAAACYRKGFFGHDKRTEDMEFDETNQQNSVIWIARQFDKAGTGKLATTALSSAQSRGELMHAELIKIEPQKNGKLLLLFITDRSIATTAKKKTKALSIECDQLIYSVGQDDNLMRGICKEIEDDLSLVYDKNNMVLNVCSPDKKVIFFGAAAMAVREKEYMNATWKWLQSENIGGDVGPGSMPPSRAQIKCYNFLRGLNPNSINANMDSHYLITKYLEKAGVEEKVAASFVEELLNARKASTCGASHSMIQALLTKHKLDQIIEIKGHGHLALKTESHAVSTKSKQQLLSWLGPQRTTKDADIFVSSVHAEKTSKATREKEEQGVQLITEIRT
ncbi:hypothetical protein [Fluoribacter gormanii]|uniref:hypothetical protein n=1 Tax=Fluoribacter gormanii TaxID=464 RepID=UPI0010418DD6|nr:hypothetical protein [Fluoribacter gormanii]